MPRPSSRTRRDPRRHGVASVLAMMFLVIFGSLAAAMAVVATGNIRTADVSLRVSRATSAAETGLVYGTWILEREARRFVVMKGEIDADYADDLWNGSWDVGADGAVEILDPEGYVVASSAESLADAVRDAHLAGDHAEAIEPGDAALPSIGEDGALDVRPIRVSGDDGSAWFRLRYEPVPGVNAIRIVSEGVDREVRRTLSMLVELDKRIEYAVVSPNRIMIGKNVMILGPLGTRFGENPDELNGGNGDPLDMRSDVRWLSADLDASLDAFEALVIANDADDDGRLRPDHPVEGSGLEPDFIDLDGDEFVDEFDLFLAAFDLDEDGRVVYDADLSGGATVEFDGIDDQYAHLLDNAVPDRNADGVVDDADTDLGYRDGVLDSWDRYAKVQGRLAFAVERSDWEAEHGAPVRSVVRGSVRPELDQAAMRFGLDEDELRVVTTDMFADSAGYFLDVANAGDDFDSQVAAGVAAGGEALVPGDDDHPGYETTPLGSSNPYDLYLRPIYRGITFEDVKIPVGTNALFEDCRFVGVTYVETDPQCTDPNWNYAGSLEDADPGEGFLIRTRFEGLVSSHPDLGEVLDSKPLSNNLRFADCTFLGSLAGDTPNQYTHWRNKVQVTGASRFFSDPSDPDLLAQPDGEMLQDLLEALPAEQLAEMRKSSIMMPGWSVDVGSFTNEVVADDLDATPRVELRGVIVAGILDIRGTALVEGTLLMTFRPTPGEGPLFYDGQADAFNTTIGYFGPDDGDGEGSDPLDPSFSGFGEIVLEYDEDVVLPDGIPWPIVAEPIAASYREGTP
ncbi:MAG: hypothetical protein VX726_12325 [Planctomycetota bacterium]|nr:hypothetical protein [Planctomycetota bacterium]